MVVSTRYKIVDSDAHMIEPVDLWQQRVDGRFRERAPRLVKDPDGQTGMYLVTEGILPTNVALAYGSNRNLDKDMLASGVPTLEGGWDPAARIKDMEVDGVDAAVLYPTFPIGFFNLEDVDLQNECFRVYNDWLAEFCAYDPRRFAGLALISLLDIERGTRELERCGRMGLKGAIIWASPPEREPFLSPNYDRFWAAAQELSMPLSLHLGTGRGKTGLSTRNQPGKDSGKIEFTTNYWVAKLAGQEFEIKESILRLLFGGILERFPGLKIVSAENEIAWIPSLLQRADHIYARMQKLMPAPITMQPSQYFQRQCYATFIEDPIGVKSYHLWDIVDNIMWSTDYPHPAATWPHSQEILARDFDGVPEEDKRKIISENAAKLYHFAEAG